MPCAHPLKGWRSLGGKVTFQRQGAIDNAMVRVSCGQCAFCRRVRALAWSTRIMCEASLHKENSFITLTYKDDVGGLCIEHVQKFFKRFRKAISPAAVRYFCVGEYGDRNSRAHWHAILFGWSPNVDDRLVVGSGKYDSRLLNRCWGHGFTSVGDLTPASASYCSGYALKKITGKVASDFYFDELTGEYCRPETLLCSRNPGIGSKWFEQNMLSVFPDDGVVFNGNWVRPPKAFFEKLKVLDPALADKVKEIRSEGFDESEYYRLVWSGVADRVLRKRQAVSESRHKEF